SHGPRQARACPHVDHDQLGVSLLWVGIGRSLDGSEPDRLSFVARVIDHTDLTLLGRTKVAQGRLIRDSIPRLDSPRDQIVEAELAGLGLEEPDRHLARIAPRLSQPFLVSTKADRSPGTTLEIPRLPCRLAPCDRECHVPKCSTATPMAISDSQAWWRSRRRYVAPGRPG